MDRSRKPGAESGAAEGIVGSVSKDFGQNRVERDGVRITHERLQPCGEQAGLRNLASDVFGSSDVEIEGRMPGEREGVNHRVADLGAGRKDDLAPDRV